MPKNLIYRVIFRSTDVFDVKIGNEAYNSRVKEMSWAKDDTAGPVFVIDLENGTQVCIPEFNVLNYMAKDG